MARPMRVRPPWWLVVVLVLLHLWGAREVSRLTEGWADSSPEPERLQVAFVREMQVAARPPAPARPPPGKPRNAAPRPASSPDLPASAPEAAPVAALSEPAAATDMAQAASAPESAAAAEPAASAAEAEPGPEWPLSTRLTYALTGDFRGPVHGQAQVEWLRRGRDYQVHLEVAIGPSFAPFATRRVHSSGVLTERGISPRRFDEETKILIADPRRVTVRFLPESVVFANGRQVPLLPGAQDTASQFVQLTWLALTGRVPMQVGQVIEQPLVMAYRQYPWRYEVVGEEEVATPMGRIAAWHLKPDREAVPGDLTAEVWLAPSLQYMPVRLRMWSGTEMNFDLRLKTPPLQAAPETESPASPSSTPSRRLP